MGAPRPIRVCQYVGKMRAGGVESFLMNYYRHIDRERIQFDFVIDEDSPNHELVPEIESLGGRVHEVPPYQDLMRYLPAMERTLRLGGWEVVHSQVNALSVFPLMAAKRAGVPVRIAHSHSAAGRGEGPRVLLKHALRAFSDVFPTHRAACSRHAGRWLFGGTPFVVVADAIELSRFSFSPSDRADVRADLGIGERDIVLGHVGRFMEQKNHAFLLDAFAAVARADGGVWLVLVGEGPLMGDVRMQAESLGVSDHVLFLGQRQDVGRLYSAMDAFLLPSLYEGLGMVAIEAQASGLPCLLSDAVPAEAGLAPSVEFLPLSAGPDAWARACVGLVGTCPRVLGRVPHELAQYDIVAAAPRLADLYERAALGEPWPEATMGATS